MLKCRSTVHEVTWQFNNLAYSCGLIVCLAGSFLELLLGHYSEQNYTEIVLKHVF